MSLHAEGSLANEKEVEDGGMNAKSRLCNLLIPSPWTQFRGEFSVDSGRSRPKYSVYEVATRAWLTRLPFWDIAVPEISS